MALVVFSALQPMVDRNPVIKYKALSVPQALLLRHLFEIFQNSTLEVIHLLETLLLQIRGGFLASNTAGAEHGHLLVF